MYASFFFLFRSRKESATYISAVSHKTHKIQTCASRTRACVCVCVFERYIVEIQFHTILRTQAAQNKNHSMKSLRLFVLLLHQLRLNLQIFNSLRVQMHILTENFLSQPPKNA